MTIIDVAIPYEGDSDAFTKARNVKRSKYQPIASWLVSKGVTDVSVDAFIIGSLGSWDPNNAAVLQRLCIGKKYSVLLKKLCSIDAINGSLTIWRNKE